MVYTKHFCEICKNSYDKIEDAKSCESKGFIGSKIIPGLILRSNNYENSYHLISDNSTRGHYRSYSDNILNFNKRGRISFWGVNWNPDLTFKQLVSYLHNNTLSFINKEELEKVKKNIVKSRNKDLKKIIKSHHPEKEFYRYEEKIDPEKIPISKLEELGVLH